MGLSISDVASEHKERRINDHTDQVCTYYRIGEAVWKGWVRKATIVKTVSAPVQGSNPRSVEHLLETLHNITISDFGLRIAE